MKGHQQLEPVQGLTPVDEEEFRKAAERAQGKLLCWVITGVMGANILQQTLDIGVITSPDLGRTSATKGFSRKLIAVTEAAGYSQETCASHKVAIGYALLLARGQLDLIPKVPTMLRPDFIWVANTCQANLWSAKALGRIFDVPVIALDIPFEYDVANREGNLDYVESQLREALDILETWVGRPLDWPRLAEHIRGLAEVADMRNEVNQMCKTCPSVCSAFDLVPATYVYRTAPVEEGKRAYRALREEIEGKIERGERDVPEEKLRIAWYGAFPWAKAGAIKELFARYGATLCSSSHYSTGSPTERGEGLDPGNPLRTAAWMLEGSATNKSIDTRTEEWIKPSIEGYNVDGVIFHMSRTCKIMGIPMLVWAAEVEKKLGLSTLIVESDAIDPAFYDQTQVENRIESFLESIAGRKAGV